MGDKGGRVYVEGERFATAREDIGAWGQHKLHGELKKAGFKLSYGWLASVESGRVKRVFASDLRIIAGVLKKPVEFFVKQLDASVTTAGRPIPVYGYISSGTFDFSMNGTPESHLTFCLPSHVARKSGAWRVVGDSLKGIAENGSYLIAVEADTLEHGTLAIVRRGDKAAVERVKRGGSPDGILAEVLWIVRRG